MAELAGLVQRLEVAVTRLENMSGSGAAAAAGVVSAYVEAFDDIIASSLNAYLTLSQKIGGDVQRHADMMKRAFTCQRQLLLTAASSQKPSEAVLTELLKPLSKVIQEIQGFREKNRSSPFFNHLSAVSESVPAVGWLAVSPKPGPYVKEMQDAGMFYSNRVLKEFKDKDKTHVDWTKAYMSIWTDLQTYIKQHHTVGVAWSKTGPPASCGAAPAGGCPPPPPPGPPPPMMDVDSSGGGKASGADSRNALFAAINKGANITSGLKHVKDEQKTHKNPTLRTAAPVEHKRQQPSFIKPVVVAKTPVKELEGKKWKVEHQDGVHDLEIKDTELKQVVYAFKCKNSTLQVKGKINSIILDSCQKMGLVFENVVGIVEVINCQSVTIQVLGKVPTISVNKTEGCQIYLSSESLDCELVSAKSSEMNVLVPKKDGEFTEIPVPEQFKTTWNGSKLVTTATEMAG